ncbi:MAG: helix-turn-helix domain-containing protein, partial [Muribaculaceae bacterium]|nr:helix-turn-helix domain-containing protein [Muribaculaceae bacterium]
IQEIAYETGFSTPGNFNRVFKQITGTNPSTFCKKK